MGEIMLTLDGLYNRSLALYSRCRYSVAIAPAAQGSSYTGWMTHTGPGLTEKGATLVDASFRIAPDGVNQLIKFHKPDLPDEPAFGADRVEIDFQDEPGPGGPVAVTVTAIADSSGGTTFKVTKQA
jgi:hypothetical protein